MGKIIWTSCSKLTDLFQWETYSEAGLVWAFIDCHSSLCHECKQYSTWCEEMMDFLESLERRLQAHFLFHNICFFHCYHQRVSCKLFAGYQGTHRLLGSHAGLPEDQRWPWSLTLCFKLSHLQHEECDGACGKLPALTTMAGNGNLIQTFSLSPTAITNHMAHTHTLTN